MSLIYQVQGLVRTNSQVAASHWQLWLAAPEVASAALPGQFIHLYCGGGIRSTIRRPFSIHRVDRLEGEASILYQIRGEATNWLTSRREGDQVDIIGPLGHGFPLPPGTGHILLVAGGVGIAPLFFLAEEAAARGVSVTCLLGARCSEQLLRVASLQRMGVQVVVATDDGSEGYHGLVTGLLPEYLAAEPAPTAVYTCGPAVMMKTVAGMAASIGVPCWASLEERMACGIGACRGCVVALKEADGRRRLENACTSGPVFDAREVIWP